MTEAHMGRPSQSILAKTERESIKGHTPVKHITLAEVMRQSIDPRLDVIRGVRKNRILW